MKSTICLFEDSGFLNLLPLVYLRPVYDLKCGILSLREKVEYSFPNANLLLHSRNYLSEVIKERYPTNKFLESIKGDITFINGRLIAEKDSVSRIKKLKYGEALVKDNIIIAIKLDYRDAQKYFKEENNNVANFLMNDFLLKEMNDAKLINYPWELVNYNGDQIKCDFQLLRKKSNCKLNKNVIVLNKKSVFIDKGTKINPFVFLDASDGPIYIGKDVEIMSHVTIKGPVYIGDKSLIKSHTAIYHKTSIGKVCKIGGEIENSIIMDFTNKQHEGFLGHSYLCSWINVGASTNNSDLKNNYSSVDVYINGKIINSGSQFVGLFMGDHSKTAINTMFNTGTTIGVACNIFGSGFPPKYIPSFSWGGHESLITYDINKCIETAQIVMKRRNIDLTKNEKELLGKVFELTSNERTR